MSCIRSKWCPECREVAWDPICMCLGTCDKHPVAACTTIVPDGRHPYREKGKQTAASEVEYANGWEIGHMGWPPGHGFKNAPVWCKREPGHPTKSPQQLRRDEMEAEYRIQLDRKLPFSFDQQPHEQGSGI